MFVKDEGPVYRDKREQEILFQVEDQKNIGKPLWRIANALEEILKK